MSLIRLLKRDLAREVADWVEDGVITRPQAAAICRRYGIDPDDPQARSVGYFVLLALGYLFIGLAVITLIGANWDEIPRALRMLGLIAVTVAVSLAGVHRFHWGRHRAAVGLLFLGALLYGASIMLIAQIYHLGEHFPDGIFWWALGVLPAALLLESVLLMTLTAALAFLWFFMESNLGFYPALFPLFIAALAWQCWRGSPSNLIYLVLLGSIVLWGDFTVAWWLAGEERYFAFGGETIMLVAAMLLAIHALGGWQRERAAGRWADYGAVTVVWIPRLAVVLLLVLSFEEPWREMIEYQWRAAGAALAATAALGSGAVALTYAAGRQVAPIAMLSLFLLSALAAAILTDNEDYAVALQVATNLVLVGTGAGLIMAGNRRSETHAFYLGVLTILATALLRYVDLVGDYVGAALLFLVFAVVMLTAAGYWRRQQMAAGARA